MPLHVSRDLQSPALGNNDFSIPYLDDLLVSSGSFEDHLKHVELVLQKYKDMTFRLRYLNVNYLKGKFVILEV